MKSLFPFVLACALAFTLAACSSSQRTIFLLPPSDVKGDTVDVAAYERKYGKHDGVFIDIEESIEHAGFSTESILGGAHWDYYRVVRRKYVVLNPDKEELTTFTMRVNSKAKIGRLFLRVTSPSGIHTQYGLKDLAKESASEYIINYKFAYPNITKGCIIEEGFEVSYSASQVRPPLQYDIPLQFSIPCERVSFSFAYPDWWLVDFKQTDRSDTISYTTTNDAKNRKKVISCELRDLPAVKDEPYDPYVKEMAKYLEFMVTSLDMGLAGSYEAPKDWDTLIKRYRDALTDREGASLFGSRVKEKTQELTAHKKTRLETLTTILDYVQSEIEIATDGKDRDFADVLKDKKGDSYEIAGLTNMMMKKAGLQSEFMMVHSAGAGYFDQNYVSFSQLSIPVVDVKVDGKEYVLFPYRKDIPYDHVPEYAQGQTALVVSNAPKAVFATIPSGSQTRNNVREQFDVVIDEDGIVHVKETKTIQGSYAFFVRHLMKDMKQTERDKFLKELIAYSEGEVTIDSSVLENEKEHKKPLVLRYVYTINNLVTLTPDEVLFHTAGLFAPTSMKDFRVESEGRDNPIRIYYDDEYTKEISIRYPDAWEMKTPVEPVNIENAFGSLKLVSERNGASLSVQQQRTLKRIAESKEKIADLAKLTGSKASTALPTILFKKKLM